jgi:hypothetical protein
MLESRVAVAALSVATLVAACTASRLPQGSTVAPPSSQRMPDGKQWLTKNLAVNVGESFCYGDVERGCNRYGRLYTWGSAPEACRSLPGGWRLPTDDDWRQLASHFGGAFDNSPDSGKAAYEALLVGGASTFAALLGGGRAPDGSYDDGSVGEWSQAVLWHVPCTWLIDHKQLAQAGVH